jgi:hypothetical protein
LPSSQSRCQADDPTDYVNAIVDEVEMQPHHHFVAFDKTDDPNQEQHKPYDDRIRLTHAQSS